MKNTHFSTPALMLASFLFASPVFSQTNELASSNHNRPDKHSIIGTGVTSPQGQSKASVHINTKVERSFVKFFKQAENIYWSEKEGYSIAEFTTEGRHAVAWFTPSGVLYCSNYYGTAKHLPYEYKKMMELYYRDYEIVSTTEIKCNTAVGWVITIQNCSSVKKVKIVEGALEEIEHFNRQR